MAPIWRGDPSGKTIDFALCVAGEVQLPVQESTPEKRAKVEKHDLHIAARQAWKSFSYWIVDPTAATDLHARPEPFMDDIELSGRGVRCLYGRQFRPEAQYAGEALHLAFRCDPPVNEDPMPALGCDFVLSTREHDEHSEGNGTDESAQQVATGADSASPGSRMHSGSRIQISVAKGTPAGDQLALAKQPLQDAGVIEDVGQLIRHPDIMKKALASGPVIKVLSFAGMCNQLRTLISFAKWARLHNKKLVFYWSNTNACPADFDEVLVEPDAQLWNVTIRNAKDRPKGETIDVKTIYTIFDAGYDYYPEPFGLLRPVPAVLESVRGVLDRLQEDGHERFLAVHVRRTDMDKKFFTPDAKYLDWVNLADPEKKMKVFIATDNRNTQKYFSDHLGERAFVFADIKGKNSNQRQTSLQHAMSDILVASMSSDFMNSPHSSFSRMIMGLRQHRVGMMRMLGIRSWGSLELDPDTPVAEIKTQTIGGDVKGDSKEAVTGAAANGNQQRNDAPYIETEPSLASLKRIFLRGGCIAVWVHQDNLASCNSHWKRSPVRTPCIYPAKLFAARAWLPAMAELHHDARSRERNW